MLINGKEIKMEKTVLLKRISSLVMEYESDSGNNSLVGCYVQFMDDSSVFEFNGENFTKERVYFRKG